MSRTLSIALLNLAALLALGLSGCEPKSATPPTAAEPAPQTPPPAPVKAEAGVGKEGQSLKNESGIGRMIAQPAITLFAVKQRAVFEMQIPSAMNLFHAPEGRYPKSHEEFMTKIIQANNIKLPKLPDGQVYKYDVEKHELWVYPAE